MGRPKPPGHVGIGEGGHNPLVGWFSPFPWPMKPPNTCWGSRNTFRSCWSSPGTSGTLPDSKTFVQYNDLHFRTILELLIMSGISSGTPNNIR